MMVHCMQLNLRVPKGQGVLISEGLEVVQDRSKLNHFEFC